MGLCVAVHNCNPNTWETEAGGSSVQTLISKQNKYNWHTEQECQVSETEKVQQIA
jgi:hypothetical protein